MSDDVTPKPNATPGLGHRVHGGVYDEQVSSGLPYPERYGRSQSWTMTGVYQRYAWKAFEPSAERQQ